MKLIATIYEPTVEQALDAIRSLPPELDGVELRADRIGSGLTSGELEAFRAATSRELIFTRRSQGAPQPPGKEIQAALAAGFDFVDVELSDFLDSANISSIRNRVILSHHDFHGTPDLAALIQRMARFGSGPVKIAVMPRSFADNQRIIQAIAVARQKFGDGNASLFGMGAEGLYSRILAPFFGSQLQFVAVDDESTAAPGQLTIERASLIYGDAREFVAPESLFAIVGRPASHSLSPAIHNSIFRDIGIAAAYSILDTNDFDEVFDAFAAGAAFAPRGLSVTAPFKEKAFARAASAGAVIGRNAAAAKAVNTLVRDRQGRIFADNTDVDGFEVLLKSNNRTIEQSNNPAAVIGAGGTARAAVVALTRFDLEPVVFNRSIGRAEGLARDLGVETRPLEDIRGIEPGIVINTVTETDVALDDRFFEGENTYIEAGYSGVSGTLVRALDCGLRAFSGLDLLEAQALRQSRIFIASIETESAVRGTNG